MESEQAKRSAFVETFGGTPLVKVVDFFLMYPDFDYSKSQVASDVVISRITIEGVWKKLTKNGVIVKTRSMGRAELYRLNRESPMVKTLMKTAFELAGHYLEGGTEKAFVKQKVKAFA